MNLWGEVGWTSSRPSSSGGHSKVALSVEIGFFLGPFGSSASGKERSVFVSVRPSSMSAFRSSRSMREGLSPANSSCCSRAISPGDI